jgi:hypothetical protein
MRAEEKCDADSYTRDEGRDVKLYEMSSTKCVCVCVCVCVWVCVCVGTLRWGRRPYVLVLGYAV